MRSPLPPHALLFTSSTDTPPSCSALRSQDYVPQHQHLRSGGGYREEAGKYGLSRQCDAGQGTGGWCEGMKFCSDIYRVTITGTWAYCQRVVWRFFSFSSIPLAIKGQFFPQCFYLQIEYSHHFECEQLPTAPIRHEHPDLKILCIS